MNNRSLSFVISLTDNAKSKKFDGSSSVKTSH